MKREPGQYYKNDRVKYRAASSKLVGTVLSTPKLNTPINRVQVQWDGGSKMDVWKPAIMLAPSYVEEALKKMNPDFVMPKEGDRVKIPSIGRKGTINFICLNDLFFDHMSPIQVVLDEPYDDSPIHRTGLKDLKLLTKDKKSKKKKKPAPKPVVEEDILWDDDEEISWDDDEAVGWD